MRLLLWTFRGLWAGSTGSFIIALLLLLIGIIAFYFMVLPYFNPILSLSEADLADLTMPLGLQRVKIEGELHDGDRRAGVEDELAHFGVLELKDHLLLVASYEALDEEQNEFYGTLIARDPEHVDIYEAIVDDENLNGDVIPALFLLGEVSPSKVFATIAVDAIVFALGILGVVRFFLVRRQQSAT